MKYSLKKINNEITLFWEMLTCALKAQVNDSNIKIMGNVNRCPRGTG
jgi:hypothetical protein